MMIFKTARVLVHAITLVATTVALGFLVAALVTSDWRYAEFNVMKVSLINDFIYSIINETSSIKLSRLFSGTFLTWLGFKINHIHRMPRF